MIATCNCPPAEKLRDFLRGDLESAEIEIHLDDCTVCRQAFDTEHASGHRLAGLLRPVDNDASSNDPLLGNLTIKAKALASPLVVGQVVGDYEVLEPIARGGMGWVFKARHRRMNRVVAIKTIAPALSQQGEAAARFQREVEAIARLSHPHIVAAHDAFDQLGGRYLVMEYVQGGTLEECVQREGRLSVERALAFIRQAAEGLAHAHAAGIVHRDVKPSNLLLTRDTSDSSEGVKVLDLGLARTDQPRTDDLSGGNMVMGTAAYMAPEQAVDPRSADARADVYSLGCTLYYLLTGEPPYRGDSALKTVLAHREEAIPSLREARRDCPPAVDALFRRMIAKRAQDRPGSMRDVIRDLDAAQNGTTSTGFSRRRMLVFTAVLGAVAATIVVSMNLAARPEPNSRVKAILAPVGPARAAMPHVELVRVEPGKFWMGAGENEKDAQTDERPRHEVRVTRPFMIGKFEITQEQYEEVMGTNPSAFKAGGRSGEATKGMDTRKNPVESISWFDAVAFCNRLSEKHGLDPYYLIEKNSVTIRGGTGYRLPTEAEWEYACRAGTSTRWSHGEDERRLDDHAWHAGNASERTHPVGTRAPNAWGLHDMHGNVPEWCWDRYDARYYQKSPVVNPPGAGVGSSRVYRGGGWDASAASARSAARQTLGTGYRVLTLVGVRVARDAE